MSKAGIASNPQRSDGLWGPVTQASFDATWEPAGWSLASPPAGPPNREPMDFTDEWDADLTYIVGDVVGRSGSHYIALQASLNQDPLTASAYWEGLGGTDPTALHSTGDFSKPTGTVVFGGLVSFGGTRPGPDPYAFGAIGDGGLHPLSGRYGSLAAAQADYPRATSLTQQIDRHAIQRAIDVWPKSIADHDWRGGWVRLPSGKFRIDLSVEIDLYYGFRLSGVSALATRLIPTADLMTAFKPILLVRNCNRPIIEDMALEGYSGRIPCAIEVHEDHGAEPANVGLVCSGITVERCDIGSTALDTMDHGILWTTAGLNQNNDDGQVKDCMIFNFQKAGLRTTHLNALRHRVVGGTIATQAVGAVAVRTGEPDGGSAYDGGGSFDLDGVRLGVPGYVADYGEGAYTHPQSFRGCKGQEVPVQQDVQQVAVTGSPTGGTFTLTFEGQPTAGIARNATAAAVESALEALSNLAPADVACTGGPLPGTPVVVTFAGAINHTLRELMTKNAAGLTGGSSPNVVVTRVTSGGFGGKWFRSSSLAAGLKLYLDTSQFGSGEADVTGKLIDWQAPNSVFEAVACGFTSEAGRMDFGTSTTNLIKFFGGAINASKIAWNCYLVLDAPTDYSGALFASGLEPGASAQLVVNTPYDGPTGRFLQRRVQDSVMSQAAGGWEISTLSSGAPVLRIRGGAGKSPQFVLAGPSADHWALFETVAGDGGPGNVILYHLPTGLSLLTLSPAGGVGFLGATPVGRRTLGAAATDPASTQTLANNVRQALIDLGLGQT